MSTEELTRLVAPDARQKAQSATTAEIAAKVIEDALADEIIKKEHRTSASSLIEKNAKEYGEQVITNLFPSPIDGLKKVQRRVLWALHKIPDTTIKISGATLVSSALELHPYGDSSVYQAAIRLGQPFKSPIPLIKIKGNGGNYSDNSPAHMRYVAFELPEITKDLFFKGISDLSYRDIRTETLTGFEPSYLIPKLPFALIHGNVTIGYGFRSLTPSFAIEDVAKMVMSYAEHHKQFGTVVPWNFMPLSKHLIPYYPVAGHIRNAEAYLQQIRAGNFEYRCTHDGIMVIGQDYVEIRTISIGQDFLTKCKMVLQESMGKRGSYLDQNCNGFEDNANKKMEGNIRVTFKKTCNIFEAANVIKKLVGFTGHITPINNYVYDDAVLNLSPPQLIKIWYYERYKSILAKKKFTQMAITKSTQELEIQLLVCDDTDAVIRIIRENDVKEGTSKLCDRFKLTLHQAHMLMQIPLATLSKTSKDDLTIKMERLKAKQKELLDSYSTVNEEIYNDAEYLSKKYSSDKGLYIPKFEGYVSIGGEGVIQYEDIDDLAKTVSEFPRSEYTVHEYSPLDTEFELYDPNRIRQPGMFPDCNLPKHMQGEHIIHSPAKYKYTVGINAGKTAYYDKAGLNADPKTTAIHTGMDIVTIHKTGKLTRCKVTDLTYRKSTSSGGTTTDHIYAYPDTQEDVIIFSMNTKHPNLLRMQRVTPKDQKIITTMIGKTIVLRVITAQELTKRNRVLIDFDPRCLNRTKAKHICISDPMAMFAKQEYLELNINKSKSCKRKIEKHQVAPQLLMA